MKRSMLVMLILGIIDVIAGIILFVIGGIDIVRYLGLFILGKGVYTIFKYFFQWW